MRNVKLIIEYDGTSYSGWQVQPNGLAVQQVVEEALARILGESVRVYSSGRTDAGVHAMGMVAAFKTDRQLPLSAFSDGLNALLPADIAIRDAAEVPLVFNPRADAQSKHYRYTIFNAGRRSPLARFRSWHLRRPLDVARMQEAAFHLVGEHDFAAFRGANCAAKTTVRRLFRVTVTRYGDFVVIDVQGSGFLKNMVRVIAGTLAEVGQGKINPETIPQLLSSCDRACSGVTAPGAVSTR